MSYQALYRTYRPQCFKEVAGQKHITQTLQNALKNDKISHAYLFCGPRGTGKTTIAKILAKTVNCQHYPTNEPCNQCPNCINITKGICTDVIEMDAASNNGVDEIREIRDKVNFLPSEGKYKVYIIDEVHMLTTAAFNALLKTLEEPPYHVIFILATTEPYKIPATILSRCQKFDFRAIPQEELVNKLKEISEKEKIDIDPEALEVIAQNAEGGVRDSLSLLDEVISYQDGHISAEDVYKVSGSVSSKTFLKMLRYMTDKDSVSLLKELDSLMEDGKEIPKIITDMITFFRDLLVYQVMGPTSDKSIEKDPEYQELAKNVSNQKIYFYLNILNQAQNDVKYTTLKRPFLEMALLKMTDSFELKQTEYLERLDVLETRINELEKRPVSKEPLFQMAPTESIVERSSIDISQVESILNHANKEKKHKMLQAWPRLKNMTKPGYTMITKTLSQMELVAMNEDTMLLVHPDVIKCNYLMNKQNRVKVLDIFNAKTTTIRDIVCIPKDKWDIVSNEFKEKWKNGDKNPHLSPIDFGVIVENKIEMENVKEEEILDTRSEFEKMTENMFGKENIIYEEGE